MSSRRRQGLSPTLFPFLAVLVCTLGTLILLLALVAQNAVTAAASESRQAPEPAEEPEPAPRLTAANVTSLIEEAEFRVEQLIAFRDQQIADIEDRRDKIAHLDDHMQRLTEEMKRLNDEVEIATGQQQVASVDQQQLDRLKSKIELEAKEVARLRDGLDNQTPRVVIVPHKGPNGTDRRPVYLECTASGLTIWPEGVRLAETYLQDSVADANPLDAALRVIRNHAMRNYGDSVAPYPLLVVRPDGVDTYAAARRAMQDWDDQFGYELVPADVELAYDTSDPALKKKVDDAVRQAIIKQNAMQRIEARIAGNGSSGRMPTRKRYPTLSAASMDRQGRESGFRDHRDGYTHQNPFAPTGNSVRYGELGAGTGSDVASQLDQHLREAREDLAPGDFAGIPQVGQQPGSEYTGSGYAGGHNAGSQHSAGAYADDGHANRDGSKLGAAKQDNAGTGESSEASTLGDFAGDLAARRLTTGGDGNRPGDHSAGLVDPMFAASREQSGSTGTDPSQGDSRDDSRQRGQGQQTEVGERGASEFSHLGDNQSTGPTGKGNTRTNPYLTDISRDQQAPAAKSSQRGGDQNASAGSSAQATTGASGSSPTRGSAAGMTMPDTPPSMNFSKPPPRSSNTSDLVRRQGANWALPKSMANVHGNAIVRTIHVQCYPDRFVLLPPRGSGRIEMFGLSDGDINRATIELATAIRDRITRWGAALPGGRWQPRLDVEIMPHSDRRFHQLRTLMTGSGVDVDGRPSR